MVEKRRKDSPPLLGVPGVATQIESTSALGTEQVAFIWLLGLLLNDVGEDLGERVLDEVGDEVPVDAVAVAHTHHPQVLDAGEVLVDDERILISFLLSRNKALTSFDTEIENGAVRLLFCILLGSCLLILQIYGGFWVVWTLRWHGAAQGGIVTLHSWFLVRIRKITRVVVDALQLKSAHLMLHHAGRGT